MKSRTKEQQHKKKTSKLIMKKVEKEKPLVKAKKKVGAQMSIADYVK